MTQTEVPEQQNIPIFISNKDEKGQPINVILVILESFSNKIIEPLGGQTALTPCINKLCKEGIVFSNFYSTGNRSDKGISSLLASYPALIKSSSVMGFPDKLKTMDCMPSYFKKKGYDLSFYYGGDINFYNTRMLLIQSGVNKIVERTDFPLSESTIQKWGVPDEYLYRQYAKDLKQRPQPFFSMVYNISSHEPFDIPRFNRIKGNSSSNKYCNAVAYTDSCLGKFIDEIKESQLWKNTLIIITSDHTSLEPSPLSNVEEPATYKIPMLWIGGVVNSHFTCPNISMQTDLCATLLQQMEWEMKPSKFSKNIFGKQHYALYFRNEGWGAITPEVGFFINTDTKKQRFFYGEKNKNADSIVHFTKAFTQYLHNDFIKR